MDKDQLTALAREYAEEYTKKKYPNAPGHVRERIVEGRLEHMEDFIPWLLRRYCIVEKGKVRRQFEYAQRLIGSRDYNKQCIGEGSQGILQRLFPEIAKEVEK